MGDEAPHTAIHLAVVALGANLPGPAGEPSATLLRALRALGSGAAARVVRTSSVWRSAAWPDAAQPSFLNAVAVVETTLAPARLLARLHAAERRFGRVRGAPNAPRALDLDLIAYADRVLAEDGLTLPHPRAHDRRFVMGPLAEVWPDWRHPALGRTAVELAAKATVGTDAAPVAARLSLSS